jgi:hypothetical protein
MRTAELTPSGHVASASSPVPMPAPRAPRRRTTALENNIPLPQPRPAAPAHSSVAHKTTPTGTPQLARDLTVLPTPRPADNSQTTAPELARISAPRTAPAPTIASIIAASDLRQPPRQYEVDRLSPSAAAPQTTFSIPQRAQPASASHPTSAARKHRDTPLASDNPDLPSGLAPPVPRQWIASLDNTIPQSRPAAMARSPVTHKTTPAAPHVARDLSVLPIPRPAENSQTIEPELARISAPRSMAAGAADVRQPPRQYEVDRLSPPDAAPRTTFSVPPRAQMTSASDPASAVRNHRDAQLAYNNPDLPSGPDSRTAIYDIVAHTVYLPNGERLEAHSGLGGLLDDPRHIFEKGRGATPPNVYDLTLRHPLFHGVQAIRLNPVGDARMYGRGGILAHSYMLGPSGQSFGCVSFKNYAEFLHAFLRGEIDKLVVVPHLRTAPWAARARRADRKRYAFNAQ